MDELAILDTILPELSALKGIEQSRYHHLDVYDHTLAALGEAAELQRDPIAWTSGQSSTPSCPSSQRSRASNKAATTTSTSTTTPSRCWVKRRSSSATRSHGRAGNPRHHPARALSAQGHRTKPLPPPRRLRPHPRGAG